MKRLATAGVAGVAAVLLAGCGSTATGTVSTSATPKDPAFATESVAPQNGSVATEACTLVSPSLLEHSLELEPGAGKASLKVTDLSECSYKPAATSFVLVQSTHQADAFFPASMYPVKGQQTVAVPGADRGYASVVTGSGLMDVDQLLVVKDGRGVQVSIAMKGHYGTADLVGLGRKILAEL